MPNGDFFDIDSGQAATFGTGLFALALGLASGRPQQVGQALSPLIQLQGLNLREQGEERRERAFQEQLRRHAQGQAQEQAQAQARSRSQRQILVDAGMNPQDAALQVQAGNFANALTQLQQNPPLNIPPEALATQQTGLTGLGQIAELLSGGQAVQEQEIFPAATAPLQFDTIRGRADRAPNLPLFEDADLSQVQPTDQFLGTADLSGQRDVITNVIPERQVRAAGPPELQFTVNQDLAEQAIQQFQEDPKLAAQQALVELTDAGTRRLDADEIRQQRFLEQVGGITPTFQTDIGKGFHDLELMRERGASDEQLKAAEKQMIQQSIGFKFDLEDVARFGDRYRDDSDRYVRGKQAFEEFVALMNQGGLEGAGDFTLIVQYYKILEPDSAVLQGEAEALRGAVQGFAEQLGVIGPVTTTGQFLTPAGRGRLLTAAKTAMKIKSRQQLRREQRLSKDLQDLGAPGGARRTILNRVDFTEADRNRARAPQNKNLKPPTLAQLREARLEASVPVGDTDDFRMIVNEEHFEQLLIDQNLDPNDLSLAKEERRRIEALKRNQSNFLVPPQ